MILEFSIQNYRSFKEKTVFSLVAESSKSKGDNVFDVQLPSGDEVRLLNSAVIYGPNASGKSNLLKALSSLKDMV
ncbi:MAG: ATP-binding protein, partial [Bacteroidetes bacterium]|nr:ATP-binding protein [Bacteroidota bacterium]